MSLKYGAEAIALIGIAYGLIKWVGRAVRSQISDSPRETARLQGFATELTSGAADALVRNGLVSAEAFERMTPREREFLVATAGQHLKTSNVRTSTTRLTPTSSTVVTTTTRSERRREPTVPPRLHLITPSRPPLGVAVYCPGCGTVLDRDALQRVGNTVCQRCKRPVSAHIQRGRLTVILEETEEEAAHRRRLEGTP